MVSCNQENYEVLGLVNSLSCVIQLAVMGGLT
jgi:hypothetical protein